MLVFSPRYIKFLSFYAFKILELDVLLRRSVLLTVTFIIRISSSLSPVSIYFPLLQYFNIFIFHYLLIASNISFTMFIFIASSEAVPRGQCFLGYGEPVCCRLLTKYNQLIDTGQDCWTHYFTRELFLVYVISFGKIWSPCLCLPSLTVIMVI